MQPEANPWPWGQGSGCTKMNTLPYPKKRKSKLKSQPKTMWESAEVTGIGGGGGIITGSDEGEKQHYWQCCPLWARQRRIHKDRAAMKRGAVRAKEVPGNHLKEIWGWHLDILRLSPFADIPHLQRLSPRHIWSSLFFFFVLKKLAVRGKYLCFALST